MRFEYLERSLPVAGTRQNSSYMIICPILTADSRKLIGLRRYQTDAVVLLGFGFLSIKALSLSGNARLNPHHFTG